MAAASPTSVGQLVHNDLLTRAVEALAIADDELRTSGAQNQITTIGRTAIARPHPLHLGIHMVGGRRLVVSLASPYLAAPGSGLPLG